ncbi:MAG: acetyltransferase [Microbacteriaceae bacterium]|nr:acetyltransferase [Microbacteriaceae bacterium]
MTTVRALRSGDRAGWQRLYADYGEFYDTPLTDEKAERVWNGLLDASYESFGLVAVDDADRPIGLAHYREFARPLAGGRGLYLDDLFTSPEARRSGAASALLDALKGIALERGLGVVRWITAADNVAAQRVYDRVATKTPWVTYDLDPAAGPATTATIQDGAR